MADFLTTTGEAIADPLIRIWNSLVDTLPGIVAAIIIIAVGYIIAGVLGWLVQKGLSKTKLDEKIEESGRGDAIGHLQLSTFFGQVVRWYVFVAFLIPAASLLQLGHLSELLTSLVLWLPSLIAASIIVVFGLLAADYVADKIKHMRNKWIHAGSMVVRILIIFFILDIALKEIGINVSIAENTFLILLGGVVLAAALAVGLGFGLGGMKKESEKIMHKLKR